MRLHVFGATSVVTVGCRPEVSNAVTYRVVTEIYSLREERRPYRYTRWGEKRRPFVTERMFRWRCSPKRIQDLEDYRSKMEVKSKVQRAQWMPKAPKGTTQKVNGHANLLTILHSRFYLSSYVHGA